LPGVLTFRLIPFRLIFTVSFRVTVCLGLEIGLGIGLGSGLGELGLGKMGLGEMGPNRAECERGFSMMNETVWDKRNRLQVESISSTMFLQDS